MGRWENTWDETEDDSGLGASKRDIYGGNILIIIGIFLIFNSPLMFYFVQNYLIAFIPFGIGVMFITIGGMLKTP